MSFCCLTKSLCIHCFIQSQYKTCAVRGHWLMCFTQRWGVYLWETALYSTSVWQMRCCRGSVMIDQRWNKKLQSAWTLIISVLLQDLDLPGVMLQYSEGDDEFDSFPKPGVEESVDQRVHTRVRQHDPRQQSIIGQASGGVLASNSGIVIRTETHQKHSYHNPKSPGCLPLWFFSGWSCSHSGGSSLQPNDTHLRRSNHKHPHIENNHDSTRPDKWKEEI